ncbi:MAG: SH3 domain-containing protein [Chloroflexales bacterium]
MSEPRQGQGRRGQTQRLPEDERGAGGETQRIEPVNPTIDEWSQAEPVNPGWRSERSGNRRAARRGPLPASPQEFQLWLQAGGWRYGVGIVVLVMVLLIAMLAFARSDQRDAGIGVERLAPTTASGVGQGGAGAPVSLLPTVTLPPPTPTGPRHFVVTGTGTDGLFLRSQPSTSGVLVSTLPDGTAVEQIGEDVAGGDRMWRHVRATDGQEGYVAVDFLAPAR